MLAATHMQVRTVWTWRTFAGSCQQMLRVACTSSDTRLKLDACDTFRMEETQTHARQLSESRAAGGRDNSQTMPLTIGARARDQME